MLSQIQEGICISSISGNSLCFCSAAIWETQTALSMVEKELIGKSPPSVNIEDLEAS